MAVCSRLKKKPTFPQRFIPLLRHYVFSRGKIYNCHRTVLRSNFNCFHMFHQIAVGKLCGFHAVHLKCLRALTGTRLLDILRGENLTLL